MLDSLAPARRRVVLLVAGVLAAGLVAVAAGGLVARRGPDPVAQDDRGPVVLVSGFGGSTEALEPLVDALQATGRRTAVAPVAGDGTGDLDDQAADLAAFVDRLLADTGAASVDVVGYSAGGVVARLWVRDHGGDGQARRVVTVGSPHHGTDVATLAAAAGCPPGCRQLVPDSDVLRRLNAGDETPAGPRFVSVWSEADQVVTPPGTARLAGALNLAVQQPCPAARTAHGQLPGDPVVLALLRTALGSGPPALPESVRC